MSTGSATEERQLVDYKRDAPDAYRALAALTRAGKMDLRTVELVKLLASHRNGCAHCITTHERIAREGGESDARLAALADWRASDLYDDRERAALALTEELTLVGGGVSEVAMRDAAGHFPAEELTRLVVAIIAINAWNRAWVATEAGATGGSADS
jgi:AhpD family alkylhydroperoxidase